MSEELGHVPKFVRLKAMDCFVLRNKHMEKFIIYYLSIFTILHHPRFSAVFSSPLHFPSPFSYFFPSRFTISLPLSLILDLKENFSRHQRTAVLSFCFQRSKKQNIPNQGKENFEIYKFGNVIISILSIYSQAKKTADPCYKQPTMCFFVG